MKQAAQTVDTDLTADTALQAEISGKHYWELAPDTAKVPYITFRLRENRRPSKDKSGSFGLEVWCFEKTLAAAANISELAKTALENANHRFQGAESGYIDDDTREGFIKLEFNFNI